MALWHRSARAGMAPQVLPSLLIQASIVNGGRLLNRWMAPAAPIPQCCAPPLVL